MSTKSVTPIEPVPLGNGLLKNNEETRSDIIRNLSGTVAWVIGYVKGGEDLDTDTPNPVAPSPMTGKPGHTHSGGHDGKALFRTIASATLDDHATHSSNVESQVALNNVTDWSVRAAGTPIAAPGFDLGDGTGVYSPMGPELFIYVPGCDPRVGAYLELGWRAHIDVRTNTNVAAGDVLTMRISNTTSGATAEDTLSGLNSATVSAALASDSSNRLVCIPGRWNRIQVSGEFVADATAGVRALSIALTGLELGVYET